MQFEAARKWPGETRFALAQAAVFGAGPEGAEWTASVSEVLGIPFAALPSVLSAEDVSRVSDLVTKDLHAEIACLLVLVSLGLQKESKETKAYSARDRARVFRTLEALSIPSLRLFEAEAAVAGQLQAAMQEQKQLDTSSALAAAAGRSKMLRRVAIGTATVVGGVALGVTGGLAAPALLALGGSALTLGAGATTIGVVLGLGGGGLAAYRANRRFKDIEQFEFISLQAEDQGEKTKTPSLTATICCAGLLVQPDDYIAPFRPPFEALPIPQDVWAIMQERDFFLEQGQNIDHYLRDKLLSQAGTEIIKRTALNAFYLAVALPATVYSSMGTLLDNNWQRSADKASRCGVILADVLESEIHGKRPVSLIGSGLGALTVFRALVELEKRQKLDTVCDAHLISLPRSPSKDEWNAVRNVTSRRLTNVFSTNDWVLALVARLHSLSYNVAGLAAVEIAGVENVDVSDLLEGHLALRERLPAILGRLDLMK